MRIGCLQFAPKLGDVNNNINRADAVLSRADPEDLDLLVLPELAFTGYNFKSLREISPFLEYSGTGISSLWAKTTALKYDCTVVAGYPEREDLTDRWPADPAYYNSVIGVSPDGESIINYRKSHLYYTDETWALEGPDGFYAGRLPGLGRTAIGICMDLKFQSPWEDFEFAQHSLKCGARLVIVSMAWLTQAEPQEFAQAPQEPDMETLMYWISRLEPIIQIRSNQEVFVVFANRTGMEDEATYAGTSAVVGIKEGEILVYGLLGRGDKELLVVDTDDEPFARLVHHQAVQAQELDEEEVVRRRERYESPPRAGSRDFHNSRGAGHSSRQQYLPDACDPDDLIDRLQSLQSDLGRGPKRTGSCNNLPLKDDFADQRPWVSQSMVDNNKSHRGKDARPVPSRRINSSTDHQFVSRHDPELYYGRAPSPPRQKRQAEGAIRRSPPGSDTSVESSQLNYAPESGLSKKPNETDWTTPDIIDGNATARRHQGSKRHGLESLSTDVPGWSDRPGRHMTEEEDALHQDEMAMRRIEEFLRDPGFKPASHNDFQDRVMRPTTSDQSKSRNHSTKHHHSGSGAQHSTPGPGIARRQTADASTRHHESTLKNQMDYRQSTAPFSALGSHKDNPREPGNSYIRIAIEPETQAIASRQSSQDQSLSAESESEAEPPILRPASRSNLGDRHDYNRGRNDQWSAGRSNIAAWAESIPQSATTATQASRQLSRGRQPESVHRTRATPSRNQQGSRASRTRGEDVDLAQFNLIEEYPSANCPLHGSRSRSAAHNRSHSGSHHRSRSAAHQRRSSRRRDLASTRHKPGSRDVHEPQRQPSTDFSGLRSKQRPASRQRKDDDASPALRKGSSSRRKSSKPDPMVPRHWTQSVAVHGSDQGSRRNRSDVKEQVVHMKPARLDLRHGPKTPKAMVLLRNDEEDEDAKADAPSNQPHDDLVASKESDISLLSRSHSAVW